MSGSLNFSFTLSNDIHPVELHTNIAVIVAYMNMAPWLILAFFSLCYIITLAQDITVSIGSYNGFTQQHSCVQGCLAFPSQAGQDVGVVIKCDYPYFNGCFCASSAAAAASGFLTSCVSSRCSQGDLPADVTSAVSIYDYYCLTAGYTLPGITTATIKATAENTITIPPTPSQTQQGSSCTIVLPLL